MGKLLLVLVLLLTLLFPACITCYRSHEFSLGQKVALVEVKGVIIEPDDVVEDLENARKDGDFKAVVVRVDSPGGSVGASQEIFRTIKNVDKEKPVVISMGDVAASGGYYLSAGARKIFANEGTITGSIGVRMEHVNASRLFELMRLQPETLKSGEFKDIGSAYRAMRPEERKILEDFLVELHGQFKSDVAASRKLEPKFVDEIADGRVYSGLKAKEFGLVDEIGGLVEAVAAAAELANIREEPNLVRVRKEKPWWFDLITEKFGALVSTGYKYFLYKWEP